MSTLRSQVISRIDALFDRGVGVFTPELCVLNELGTKDEGQIDLVVANALGGPSPLVWSFSASVFDVLLELFTEGVYSAKVVEGQSHVMLALATCEVHLNMPPIMRTADFRHEQQHWLIMSVHKGVVPDSGHWIGAGTGASSFHWAPKADCSVCANVASS